MEMHMQDSLHSQTDNNLSFSQKIVIAASIVSLFVIVLLLISKAFNVVLLILGGTLIATWFRGLSYLLSDKTRLPEKWSLLTVIGGTIMIITLLIVLLGTKIQSQAGKLKDQLPSSVNAAKQQLSEYKWGSQLTERYEKMRQNPGTRQKVMKAVKRFFRGTLGIAGDIYIMLFIGIFFTATPNLYIKGILRLIPPKKRERGNEVLIRLGHTLRSWLIGKVFAMFVVAVLTAIALYIIGVPFALTLAIIAGLLNFIPNFGPMIAMIPAVLIGFTQGMNTALIIAGVYIFIQVAESNFITPFIQKKLIEIPPALIIIAQVFVGAVTGIWGIVLATPIVAIILVLVKSLYVEPMEEKG